VLEPDTTREDTAAASGRIGDVGSRVDAILRAAEEAGEALRAEARAEAASIRERADQDARARISELTAEADRARREADDYASDIRLAVDAYAAQERREATEEAERARAEAQEEARAMREAAEAMARDIEAEARRRAEDLRQEIRLLDDRRQRAFESLRDVAAQLEDVLVRPRVRDRESAPADATDIVQ
jgi:hypothetical protein